MGHVARNTASSWDVRGKSNGAKFKYGAAQKAKYADESLRYRPVHSA